MQELWRILCFVHNTFIIWNLRNALSNFPLLPWHPLRIAFKRLRNQADGKFKLWSLKPLEILSVKLGEVCLSIYFCRILNWGICYTIEKTYYECIFYCYLPRKSILLTERHNQSALHNTIYLEADTSMFLSNGMHCISNDSNCHFCYYI